MTPVESGTKMNPMSCEQEVGFEQVVRERDLFLELLRLQQRPEDPTELLQAALTRLVLTVGATHGFIELEEGEGPDALSWYAARGYDAGGIAGVRRVLSRGIVAEALARGRQIHTSSAVEDARFSEFESVRTQGIRAVLCAPIHFHRPLGVLYLEGAEEGGPFAERSEWLVEMFVNNLAPIAGRLFERARSDRDADLSRLLPMDGLVARSPSMRVVLERLGLCAGLDVPVLLTGQTGTGKTILARAVHANSKRAAGPFVDVNCAAVPDALFENELFGSAPGGHSNAPAAGSEGRIGAAEGGTLLLDEVGDLTHSAQAKLLQFLQSRTYYRLGDSRAKRADVRVLAATNVDLGDLVSDGRFREDLYYRLQVVQVRVPALSERTSDVPYLARSFLNAASERHGLGTLALSPAATSALQLAEWPGNVRQLAHTVESAAINASIEQSTMVEVEHVFPHETPTPHRDDERSKTLQRRLHLVRGKIVESTLHDTQWNVTEAARRLDIARSYLYKLIEAHSLRSPK